MSRKISSAVLIGIMLAGFAVAQHRTGARSYGSSHGFGNVIFPGTGHAPRLPLQGPSFPQQLGATVAGRPYPGVAPNPPGVRPHRGTVFVPYAVPIYMGGYNYPYQQYPQQPIVYMQAPQQSQPSVIINNNYMPETANPVMRQYKDEELPAANELRSYEAPGATVAPPPETSTIIEDKATIYLLAYKDQSVHPALAYWVKDDTLHYITLQGTHNRVSLGLVDVPYSEKLNRDRKVEFSLTNPR